MVTAKWNLLVLSCFYLARQTVMPAGLPRGCNGLGAHPSCLRHVQSVIPAFCIGELSVFWKFCDSYGQQAQQTCCRKGRQIMCALWRALGCKSALLHRSHSRINSVPPFLHGATL